MTSTAPGIISLSASQAEEFDPEQVGGCPRRWFMHRVERAPLPEPERSKEDGDAGHALFAMHYRGQELPKRHRMLKAVKGALATGRLPAREPGQLVESRFDGQPARDANGERLPLRHSSTLWLGGVPWDGYVDLRFYRAGMITVLDHKFSSDIHTYAKTDLLATVQMPVYALDSLRIWPDAQHVELVHNYVSRRGVDSLYVRQLVTVAQIRNRAREIEGLVQRMQGAALAKSADDVPANKKSCHTWSGCPFQSRCSAFKEKPKMELNDEELSWLNVVGGGEATPAKAAGPVGEPAPLPEFLKEKLVTTGPEAAYAAELEIASAAGALDPADEDPFAVFAPQASVPQEQPAQTMRGVGISAGPENPFVAAGTQPTASGGTSSKCPDCPHPAHVGAACTGKRGSRNCRCKGVAVLAVEHARCEPGCEKDHVVHTNKPADCDYCGALAPGPHTEQCNRPGAHFPPVLASGHLPTCVQNDAGKWLCMEGCTVAEKEELDTFAEKHGLHTKACTQVDGAWLCAEGCWGFKLVPLKVPETARVSGAAPNPPSNFQRDQPSVTGGAAEQHAEEDIYSHLPPGVAELARVQDEQRRARGWTGTLRVEVNLGPETLALLQRLLGVKS